MHQVLHIDSQASLYHHLERTDSPPSTPFTAHSGCVAKCMIPKYIYVSMTTSKPWETVFRLRGGSCSKVQWTKLLPYSTEEEADEWLNEIRQGLAGCVLSGDIATGAIFW
jgi:hypothetical protein